MGESEIITIPARSGKAARLIAGQSVKVINTHGEQVVDAWAFNAEDLSEFMSMEHWRPTVLRIIPEVGDALVTNRRRPILTLTEDTSAGVHDTLMAACDDHRYRLLGCTEYHDNCTDNLFAGMKALGLTPPEVPSPLNLFMNIPVIDGRRLEFREPESRPGGYVTLRAEIDCVVAFSACPQDILPINGKACTPTEAHFQILD
ncbi:MAG: urea carboxylase-associated family protein [Proteobacteria bacterium]|nr:urea carboxylase-associated family protein [Pseudomonadota bacterium]